VHVHVHLHLPQLGPRSGALVHHGGRVGRLHRPLPAVDPGRGALGMKRAAGIRQISLGGAGILLGVFIVFPFLWALSASLQTELAIFRRPPSWAPAPATVANYLYVFTGRIPEGYAVRGLLRSTITQEARLLPPGLRNSLEVALGVIVVNLALGPLSAYTFARERFPGKEIAYFLILGTRLLAAIAAFSFLFSYSEFFFALLMTSSINAKTTPVVIASISVNPDSSYTLIAVGIVLSIIPPMLLALLFRRFITSSLVASMEQA